MFTRKCLIIGIVLLFVTQAFAAPFLVSDPHDEATCYRIRVLNSTPEPEDDQVFPFSAQADGSLKADLVNFSTGENRLMVLACNVFGESIEVSFIFTKDMPGISTNMALINIDGIAYITTGPQEGIIQYRVIVDGNEYFIDAEADGSLLYSLEGLSNGLHSVEIYALNMWGESNPAPFGFTKIVPTAPQNLLLIP